MVNAHSSTKGLELVDLAFRYPDASRLAVDGFSLKVKPGELLCLLGPSGCGKTTILKAIAGLLKPTRGDIRMNGRSLAGIPTEKRGIGMVFQKPQLFPHLDVGANVGFGLRMRRIDPVLIRERVREMLHLVQLEGLEERGVTEISGGQAQRVALARALIIEPQVWLLDEPLSQLDANLREEMRELIRSIQRKLGITTLFVTHDQEEAVVLGDRIGLILEGRLHQIGTPPQLLETPATVEVARFFGGHNQIEGIVKDDRFHCEAGTFRLPHPSGSGPAVMVIRQEGVVLGDGTNALSARVDSARYMGTHQRVNLETGSLSLVMNAPSNQVFKPGQTIMVRFPPDRIWIIPSSV
ncbi:MAG: ABC transporter ATP-binding protein [bacterium]|nr:ABC transporter ATP-binding protein [Acidimicrobiia bacterium]MCY4650757.1 ABC transporter ATP-binding protein [bacterium]